MNGSRISGPSLNTHSRADSSTNNISQNTRSVSSRSHIRQAPELGRNEPKEEINGFEHQVHGQNIKSSVDTTDGVSRSDVHQMNQEPKVDGNKQSKAKAVLSKLKSLRKHAGYAGVGAIVGTMIAPGLGTAAGLLVGLLYSANKTSNEKSKYLESKLNKVNNESDNSRGGANRDQRSPVNIVNNILISGCNGTESYQLKDDANDVGSVQNLNQKSQGRAFNKAVVVDNVSSVEVDGAGRAVKETRGQQVNGMSLDSDNYDEIDGNSLAARNWTFSDVPRESVIDREDDNTDVKEPFPNVLSVRATVDQGADTELTPDDRSTHPATESGDVPRESVIDRGDDNTDVKEPFPNVLSVRATLHQGADTELTSDDRSTHPATESGDVPRESVIDRGDDNTDVKEPFPNVLSVRATLHQGADTELTSDDRSTHPATESGDDIQKGREADISRDSDAEIDVIPVIKDPAFNDVLGQAVKKEGVDDKSVSSEPPLQTPVNHDGSVNKSEHSSHEPKAFKTSVAELSKTTSIEQAMGSILPHGNDTGNRSQVETERDRRAETKDVKIDEGPTLNGGVARAVKEGAADNSELNEPPNRDEGTNLHGSAQTSTSGQMLDQDRLIGEAFSGQPIRSTIQAQSANQARKRVEHDAKPIAQMRRSTIERFDFLSQIRNKRPVSSYGGVIETDDVKPFQQRATMIMASLNQSYREHIQEYFKYGIKDLLLVGPCSKNSYFAKVGDDKYIMSGYTSKRVFSLKDIIQRESESEDGNPKFANVSSYETLPSELQHTIKKDDIRVSD